MAQSNDRRRNNSFDKFPSGLRKYTRLSSCLFQRQNGKKKTYQNYYFINLKRECESYLWYSSQLFTSHTMYDKNSVKKKKIKFLRIRKKDSIPLSKESCRLPSFSSASSIRNSRSKSKPLLPVISREHTHTHIRTHKRFSDLAKSLMQLDDRLSKEGRGRTNS